MGLLLPVVVAATPLLYPSLGVSTIEHPIVFGLGIALTLGLLLTGVVTFQAGVLPRPAAGLVLGAMAGFAFVFFVARAVPGGAVDLAATDPAPARRAGTPSCREARAGVHVANRHRAWIYVGDFDYGAREPGDLSAEAGMERSNRTNRSSTACSGRASSLGARSRHA